MLELLRFGGRALLLRRGRRRRCRSRSGGSRAAAKDAAQRARGDGVQRVADEAERHEHEAEHDAWNQTRRGRGRRTAEEGQEEQRSLRVQDVDDGAARERSAERFAACGRTRWVSAPATAHAEVDEYAAPAYLTTLKAVADATISADSPTARPRRGPGFRGGCRRQRRGRPVALARRSAPRRSRTAGPGTSSKARQAAAYTASVRRSGQPRLPFWRAPLPPHHLRLPDERHDSERIKGMLESLGLGEAVSRRRPTSSSSTRARSARSRTRSSPPTSAMRRAQKRENPDTRDRRRRLLRRGAARADLRRSTRRSTSRSGPARSRTSASGSARAASASRAAAFGIADERTSRPRCRCTASARFQAWVQVSMGCNSKCAYCIVPAVRGREASRRPGEIVGRGRRSSRATAYARSRCSARTSTPGAAICCPTSAPSSASCCAPATPSTGSSGSASRARTRRTSASR